MTHRRHSLRKRYGHTSFQRKALERAIYRAQHKDYRSKIGGRLYVLMLDPHTGGTALQPLDALSGTRLEEFAKKAGVR
jgi:hypothetical protein